MLKRFAPCLLLVLLLQACGPASDPPTPTPVPTATPRPTATPVPSPTPVTPDAYSNQVLSWVEAYAGQIDTISTQLSLYTADRSVRNESSWHSKINDAVSQMHSTSAEIIAYSPGGVPPGFENVHQNLLSAAPLMSKASDDFRIGFVSIDLGTLDIALTEFQSGDFYITRVAEEMSTKGYPK